MKKETLASVLNLLASDKDGEVLAAARTLATAAKAQGMLISELVTKHRRTWQQYRNILAENPYTTRAEDKFLREISDSIALTPQQFLQLMAIVRRFQML